MATVTIDDVKRIHAAEVLAGKSPKDARNGTRTLVQGALHEASPTPLSDVPPHIGAALLESRSLTAAEREEVRQHQLAQVTTEQMVASEKARLGPDSTHRDAHHYVQKLHQKGLWEKADRLVDEALGKAAF